MNIVEDPQSVGLIYLFSIFSLDFKPSIKSLSFSEVRNVYKMPRAQLRTQFRTLKMKIKMETRILCMNCTFITTKIVIE